MGVQEIGQTQGVGGARVSLRGPRVGSDSAEGSVGFQTEDVGVAEQSRPQGLHDCLLRCVFSVAEVMQQEPARHKN